MGTVSTIAPDDELQPGTLLASRYRLVQPIDRTEVAEVWEAHDEVLTRAVAVKALHRAHAGGDIGGDIGEDFRRDAVAAARLVHPNVVATYDTGTDGPVTYLVMELVRGRSLRQVLSERGALPANEAVVIGAQVARAVDHAHRAGLTHRDLDTGNVLLCDDGSWPGRVKVSDFRRAPDGDEVHRSATNREVAAIGALVHELLSGEPPSGETGPPRLRRRRAGIPKSLEAVVARATSGEGNGFTSAGALAEALEAIELDDDAEPMVRREPTPAGGVPVTARPARRSVVPLLLFVLAAAVVLGVAAIVVQGGGNETPGGQANAGEAVPIAAVSSFDPQGRDREEHDELAHLVIDHQPSTSWRTDQYRNAGFGGLKDGVGLVLRLDRGYSLGRLRVTSSIQGWAATVYVADTAADTLEGWGAPVTSARDINGNAVFDLDGRQGGAVLLWITNPGTGNRATIAEVILET
jgi:serine/threonine-protein kinase